MPRVGPVNSPGLTYNQQEEHQFRRNLEIFLQAVSDELIGTQELENIVAALSAKRTVLGVPELGFITPDGIPVPQTSGTFSSITLGADGILFTDASKIAVQDSESNALVFENAADDTRKYLKINSSDDQVETISHLSVLGSNNVIKDIQTRYRGEAILDPPDGGVGNNDVTQDILDFSYDFTSRSGPSTVIWIAFFTGYLRLISGELFNNEVYWEFDGSTLGSDVDQGESSNIVDGGRVMKENNPHVSHGLGISVFPGVTVFAVKNDVDTLSTHTCTLKLDTMCDDDVRWGYQTSGAFAFSFDLGVT